MAEGIQEPGYLSDESSKDGFVRLKVKITGLKVKPAGSGFMSKITGKNKQPEGKNAVIEKPEFHNRGFVLEVKGGLETEMKGAHYSLTIKQLPYDIEPDECYLKIQIKRRSTVKIKKNNLEDGWLYLFLKKKDPYQSWEKFIREGNLETSTD